MASEVGRGAADLIDHLLNEPWRFRFNQALRLLRLLGVDYRGYSPPGSRRLRFRTPVSLDFPASDISSLEEVSAKEGDQASTLEMTVNFMGLTGPSGVLPWHYTESLIAAKALHRERDDFTPRTWSAAHDFLDIFSHRAICLFAQAWEKYNFWTRCEQGDRDYLARNLLSFVGLGTPARRETPKFRGDGLADEVFAFYSGLLAQRPVSVSAIEAIVSDCFQIPVRLRQFVARWLQIPEEQCTRLGDANARLGVDACLGRFARDHQSKIVIELGPLSSAQLYAFIPSGEQHAALRAVLSMLLDMNMDFDLRFLVHGHDIPVCRLGDESPYSARLGWSSWLKHRAHERPERDDAHVMFTL